MGLPGSAITFLKVLRLSWTCLTDQQLSSAHSHFHQTQMWLDSSLPPGSTLSCRVHSQSPHSYSESEQEKGEFSKRQKKEKKPPSDCFIHSVNYTSQVCFYFVKPEDSTVGVKGSTATLYHVWMSRLVSRDDFPWGCDVCSVRVQKSCRWRISFTSEAEPTRDSKKNAGWLQLNAKEEQG